MKIAFRIINLLQFEPQDFCVLNKNFIAIGYRIAILFEVLTDGTLVRQVEREMPGNCTAYYSNIC